MPVEDDLLADEQVLSSSQVGTSWAKKGVQPFVVD